MTLLHIALNRALWLYYSDEYSDLEAYQRTRSNIALSSATL